MFLDHRLGRQLFCNAWITTVRPAMEVANAMHAYWQEEQLLLARQHWTREYITYTVPTKYNNFLKFLKSRTTPSLSTFLFSFWYRVLVFLVWMLLSLSLSLSLLSLRYLEICLMLRTPPPPQFPPPPFFFEICFFVSGGTRWMKEEEL